MHLHGPLAEVEDLVEEFVGRRSGRLPPIQSEVRRVLEADELTVDGDPMPEDEEARKKEKRHVARKKSEARRTKNRKLKKDLPVVHEQVNVDASQVAALKPSAVEASIARVLKPAHSVSLVQGPTLGVDGAVEAAKLTDVLALPDVIHDEDD